MYDVPATGAAVAAAVELVLARPARLGATRLIAVDGPSGSGKTTFAAPLAAALAQACGGSVVMPGGTEHGGTEPGDAAPTVTVVSTDLLATWEHPLDWWPVLEEHLLAPIAAGREARLPVMEWISGHPRPGGHVAVPPADVLVLEGVSSGRRAVRDRLTALLWVEVPDAAARLERAVARDGEAMRPFLARWQQDEQRHFAEDRTRRRVDLVIRP